jgi:membrane fusion protein (multidrug efflux system)
VETAKASLESAESNKLLVEVKRFSQNAARAQLESAQAGFDEASAAKDASTWEKDLVQVKASVQKAEATLELAQQRLDESTIKAPIGGIISDRFLDKGDTASPNLPFVTIVDMDVVKIEANVFARDAVELKIGDTAAIRPDAYPDETFSGTITNISPVVDRESQTVVIEIEAVNSEYKLKPGGFAPVEITTRENKAVPVIPVDALVKEGNEIFVYVVDDGKAVMKKVELGINDGVRAEIISGLRTGDKYIMAGKYSLKPGVSVTLAGQERKPGGTPGAPGRTEGR